MIEHLIINAFLIFGVWNIFSENMALEKVGANIELWAIMKFGNNAWWMLKPLFRCPPCMASIWGTLYFVFVFDFSVVFYVLYIFSLSGLIVVIKKIIR